MKVILRNYGVRMSTEERQIARRNADDMTRTRGTDRTPLPPRDLVAQSGPRGILVSWNLPAGYSADIQRWRIYKDTETNLYHELYDRGTRQIFVDATAGATPPVVNIFISSVNQGGVESSKVQVKGSAAVEAGAPGMPSPPAGTTGSGSNTGTGTGKSGSFGGRNSS